MAAAPQRAFAVINPGLESVLGAELTELGIRSEPVQGGALFGGDLPSLYRVLAAARTPTRVWLRVGHCRATTLEQLAGAIRRMDWPRFAHGRQGLDVRVSSHRSRLRHKDRVARKVEHAVTDALRGARRAGRTPREPLEILVRIEDDQVEVSVDAGGGAVYRRGWRRSVGQAPLRENLAAAVLRLARWTPPEALVDPMCGSGTIPLEAATIAAGRSVSDGRSYGVERWPCHDAAAWRRAREQARGRRIPTVIVGADRADSATRAAAENARRAKVAPTLIHTDVSSLRAPAATGLVVANPPWGERIKGAEPAWRALGDALRLEFAGWRVALLVPHPRWLSIAGLRLERIASFRSGGLSVSVHVGEMPV